MKTKKKKNKKKIKKQRNAKTLKHLNSHCLINHTIHTCIQNGVWYPLIISRAHLVIMVMYVRRTKYCKSGLKTL